MHQDTDSPTLILVCGLPGSGKTTHARRLEIETGAIRFCPDEWMQALAVDLYDEDRRARIEALQWHVGQQLLAQGASVIIEWGTWARSERDALRLRAHALCARTELHYLSAPLEVLFERTQLRGLENPPITREDLQCWSELFEAPDAEEIALYDWFRTIDGTSCNVGATD